MKRIQNLWEELRLLSYPKEGHVDNLDLELLDTYIAGCISTFIEGKGVLVDEKKKILKDCLTDLGIHKSKIPDAASDYFTKLRTVGDYVLKACMIRLFTDLKIHDKEKFDRKTHHWNGGLKHKELMSFPEVLVIIEDIKGTSGFYFYRYTTNGEFCGDTWHQSLDDAKYQANFEYGDTLGSWQEIPKDIEGDSKKLLDYVINIYKKN